MTKLLRRHYGLFTSWTVAMAALLIALSIALWGKEASAQQPGETANATVAPPPKPLPPGFERVAGAPETEKLDPSPLVTGAYAMFFVFMFGYVVYVARSQTAIAKEMAELSERIKKMEKK